MKTHEKGEYYHRWIAHDSFETGLLNMYVFNVFKKHVDTEPNDTFSSQGLYVNNNWLRLY